MYVCIVWIFILKIFFFSCLVSEAETEKLRSTNSQIRRKMEDSVAALQELGRENQSLQVTMAAIFVYSILTSPKHTRDLFMFKNIIFIDFYEQSCE